MRSLIPPDPKVCSLKTCVIYHKPATPFNANFIRSKPNRRVVIPASVARRESIVGAALMAALEKNNDSGQAGMTAEWIYESL
jgi:hypothetical protein